jgi:alkanesulfonate monooxygenase SsuD/methylene tetrahydromethanopterin reductase-like flavin-dependent oxidoreductase (luciferase family)
MQQAFVNLRSGRPSQLPPPVEGYTERLGSQERALLGEVLSCTSIGTPYRIRADLCNFVEQTGADELLITSQVFDHSARLRSFEIAAEAFSDVPLARIA